MRLLRDPVWRGGLVVLLRHYPAYAVAVLVGCAALALSALSGRTFVDAAEIALVQGQVDAVPRTAPADQQGLVRASMFDPSSARVEDVVTRAMDDLERRRPGAGGTAADPLPRRGSPGHAVRRQPGHRRPRHRRALQRERRCGRAGSRTGLTRAGRHRPLGARHPRRAAAPHSRRPGRGCCSRRRASSHRPPTPPSPAST